jgi:hypothetical protein
MVPFSDHPLLPRGTCAGVKGPRCRKLTHYRAGGHADGDVSACARPMNHTAVASQLALEGGAADPLNPPFVPELGRVLRSPTSVVSFRS